MKRNFRRILKSLTTLAIIYFSSLMIYTIMKGMKTDETTAFEELRINHQTDTENNDKIDWHDYDYIEKEKLRKGLGEHGIPAKLPNSMDELVEEIYKDAGFNGALSDRISLDRALPDVRHSDCKRKLYRKELSTVSVVVPFYEEHWSTLLRTVQSVLNRTPSHLIQEIILVDDYSSKDFLHDQLEAYIRTNMSKTRIIRLPERMGLIRAKLVGAKEAKGPVMVFLDSHTEVTTNWLPPLLEPIAEDYRTCVCPLIDIIDYHSLEYHVMDDGGRGVFNWDFLYRRIPKLKEDEYRPTQPFKNPVMIGGLFAISSRFFRELGEYDEGLDIWGGEQFELSFKIWQCGGRLLDAPCSRVGHIYRKFKPFPDPKNSSYLCVNYKRVIEVWMDEYKQYYYQRQPTCAAADTGDLTKQRRLRETLGCKPFKWFMEEVAFDLPIYYPLIEPGHIAEGRICSAHSPNLCISKTNEEAIVVHSRGEEIPEGQGSEYLNQIIKYTWRGELRFAERPGCFDSNGEGNKIPVNLFQCHDSGGNQFWKYLPERKWFMHRMKQRCLDYDLNTKRTFVTSCKKRSLTQRWTVEKLNLSILKDVGKIFLL